MKTVSLWDTVKAGAHWALGRDVDAPEMVTHVGTVLNGFESLGRSDFLAKWLRLNAIARAGICCTVDKLIELSAPDDPYRARLEALRSVIDAK